jgi:hypothetical protein
MKSRKGYGMKWLWLPLGHCSSIWLENLRKSIKNLSQDVQLLVQGSSLGNEATVLSHYVQSMPSKEVQE